MLVFLLNHWVVVCVLIVIGFLVAAGLAMLEAYMDFKNRPRTDMFWCYRHGYFKKEHCLPLFPELMGRADNSFVCPTCYYGAVFTEPNKRMKV